MHSNTQQPSLVLALFIFSTVTSLVSIVFYVYFDVATNQSDFTVKILDVGQGSSTLLESPSGEQLLLDTGAAGSLLRPLGQNLSRFDRHIDGLLITHFDEDHFGDASELVRRYQIDNIYVPYIPSLTDEQPTTQTEFFNLMKEKNIPVTVLSAGESLYIGEALIEVLWPFTDQDLSGLTENDRSLVTRASYNGSTIMITGDVSAVIEDKLVSVYGPELASDILVIGHHGSKTSSATAFLSAVDPDIAIISAGKNNSYGHPDPAVLERLKNLAVPIINTAETSSQMYRAQAGWFVRDEAATK